MLYQRMKLKMLRVMEEAAEGREGGSRILTCNRFSDRLGWVVKIWRRS